MIYIKNVMDCNKSIDTFISHELFKEIPIIKLNKLIHKCRQVFFCSGDILFHEGERLNDCLLLEKGSIDTLRYTPRGNEKIFKQFQRGEFIAIAAAFMDHNRHPMNIRATSNGHALLISVQELRQLCQQHTNLCISILKYVCQQLHETVNQVDLLLSGAAAERLAAYLLTLKETQHSNMLDLPLNRIQLATSLGMRNETLSRLMSEWKKKKYIQYRANWLELLDIPQLRAIACHLMRIF
ncbi:hypothetical protein AXW37_06130 [Yersinia ruckeri]|uniref:Hcp transcriptional regulator HcpR (Crp/Fnr family) n=3 Tax=Yersinia ruckeri TaxID=29486 RepID=A0A085U4M5_YERRU|nr:hypothetical protein UGYR_04050 [Yersinia ruckeri]ARZ00481.1 cAMP-regulatory protein [Yersinia ruckeri]KFE38138.1 transcriptional regulator [Yersinia ruckeri]OEU24950.1 hypothetical protein BI323_16505 [Yersinia ruckeri]OIX35122.1 hypothetical protein AXW19_05740 [Yersinia ruckeri]